MPADYWHDCSHGEDVHFGWDSDVDTELSQEHHCALCDYVSPDIAINSFALALLGNTYFWHAPSYNQDSPTLNSLEYPSLRGPPLG